MARRAAQMEVQLAHMQAQEARAAEAERAASAERERAVAELLAMKSVEAMRQEAHAKEVAGMQVRGAAVGRCWLRRCSRGKILPVCGCIVGGHRHAQCLTCLVPDMALSRRSALANGS